MSFSWEVFVFGVFILLMVEFIGWITWKGVIGPAIANRRANRRKEIDETVSRAIGEHGRNHHGLI